MHNRVGRGQGEEMLIPALLGVAQRVLTTPVQMYSLFAGYMHNRVGLGPEEEILVPAVLGVAQRVNYTSTNVLCICWLYE